MADIDSYTSLGSTFLVRIEIFNSTGTEDVLLINDGTADLEYNSETYTGIGQFLSITETQSDLRISPQELTILLSGLDADVIGDVLTTSIKGATVQVIRVFYDSETGTPLLGETWGIGNRFWGYVDNFAIDNDATLKEGSVTVSLVCSSIVGLLTKLTNGRETNPVVQKALYPGDLSMDRVPNLANANFNFGKAKR